MITIPSAIQILVSYLFYTQLLVSVNPIPLTCPPPLPSILMYTGLFSMSVNVFPFCITILYYFLDSIYK